MSDSESRQILEEIRKLLEQIASSLEVLVERGNT